MAHRIAVRVVTFAYVCRSAGTAEAHTLQAWREPALMCITSRLCYHKQGLQTVQKSIYLGDTFEPTCMAHPPTYVNKILIGGADGSLQLRNINSDTLLYTFSLQSRICCIEPSPALDVVGLGLADGSAVLLNVKFDEQVMKFDNAAGAGIGAPTCGPAAANSSYSQALPCTCLTFRYGLVLFEPWI